MAFGTVFYAGAAIWQICLMKSNATASAKQVTDIISATNTAITNAVDASRLATEKALENNKDAIDKTLKENRLASKIAMGQNEASLKALINQSRMALEASINSSRLDLRPWVILSRFELSEEPQEGVPFNATFWVVNSGKTPAVRASPASGLTTYFRYPEPPPTIFPTRSTPIAAAGVLAPGGVGDFHFLSEPKTLDHEQFVAYVNGTTVIYGTARVEYEDAFTKGIPHWTLICVEHLRGRPLNEFNFCVSGNDVDHQ